MTCCTPLTYNFADELVTTIAWSGTRPTVSVLYLQPDNTFLQMGVFTQIEITATDVIITHGGLSTGIVKILQ